MQFRSAWQSDHLVVERLNAVLQHRAVAFPANILAQLDHEVRTNADEVPVEGCVMEFAERQPVWHHRLTDASEHGRGARKKQSQPRASRQSEAYLLGKE